MNELLTLLKSLINYQNKMKQIHWNVTGPHFDSVHNVSQDLYEMLDDMIDTCGEIVKVLGGTTPTLDQCVLPNDGEFNSNMSSIDAWNHINVMVSNLIAQYTKAVEVPNLLEGIKSKLGDDQYTLIVELYKLNQRRK